ncbi:MAG: hypothetical protein UT48_C0031G0008 [Parcubacteria group bacterium GW2011_GWE2_39_37]|uniref:Glycosyltransferase RgtA/B/C/D-like domain-containing protein n=1 Tax=Candidatus Falkowbacteria bacterium GW2011_GWF2_39_8 TaxID=1618642 RepID=A0A0G0Q660_9BACT|nr:MAG: hypothetical protein UT48_C0031G0008 [Parcubacteria group bacterium GW2011_GWE2_39_37]KKR32836.1 MAG: hypothetical protein UT64_C0021G0007 [Candidatus Falkowbacteria bacterium GW2011_GWF2_39_8]
MRKIDFTNKQFLLIHGLLFCFSVFFLLINLNFFGLLFWILTFTIQYKIICKSFLGKVFDADIVLLSFHLITLSLLYYSFGFTIKSLIVWASFNFFVFSIALLRKTNNFRFELQTDLQIKRNSIFGFALLTLLAIVFKFHPMIDGHSSPWLDLNGYIFLFFLTASWVLVYQDLNNEKNKILALLYFFIFLTVVAFRFKLTFGFDTLLHQAALSHIAIYGKILPLNPFYIGQYVWELLINYVSGWEFNSIERWFGPISFVLILFRSGTALLKSFNIPEKRGLIAISALLLLPNQFYYTSPFNFSVSLGILALTEAYLYVKGGENKKIYTAWILSISTILVHPLVGINILASFIILHLVIKNAKRKILFAWTTIISFAVVFAFIFFNWLNGNSLIIANPFYFIGKFINVFGDPTWYVWDGPPFFLSVLYWLERLHLPIVILVIIFFSFKKNLSKPNRYLVLTGLSFIISAWFFASSFEIPKYTIIDQLNYVQRLLIVAKWSIWPIFLIYLVRLFEKWQTATKKSKILTAFIFACFATTAWYFTYQRSDDISRTNISSIRQVDYRAIESIYKTEGGKNGYLVFANQLFGAGAINIYGFGPYYQDNYWGNLHYYSVPMASELNLRYEKIMSATEFDYKILKEPLERLNLCTAYLIITDYWPLNEKVEQNIAMVAEKTWKIEDKVEVYRFNICKH